MQNLEKELLYWCAARKKRGISINRLAKEMSERTGNVITQNQLSNWEYKRNRNPHVNTWRAIEEQIQKWRREDSMVGESQATYGANFMCPMCQTVVPGPEAGAKHCLSCGGFFDCKVCQKCGHVEHREAALFCVKCGSKLKK